MSRLVRKISSVAKWTSPEWASASSIPADAISSDLRTTDNTLSFWRIVDGDAAAEQRAVLALLGTLQRLDKIDIAVVNECELEGFQLKPTVGNTIFSELADLHVDLADLNHESLGKAARVLAGEVYGHRTQRLTRLQVKQKILAALNDGAIVVEKIPADLKADLGLS